MSKRKLKNLCELNQVKICTKWHSTDNSPVSSRQAVLQALDSHNSLHLVVLMASNPLLVWANSRKVDSLASSLVVWAVPSSLVCNSLKQLQIIKASLTSWTSRYPVSCQTQSHRLNSLLHRPRAARLAWWASECSQLHAGTAHSLSSKLCTRTTE